MAYVLSDITGPQSSGNPYDMRAQIVDMSTGATICSKEFSYQPIKAPSYSSFLLAGPDRQLAYCGGDSSGKCHLLDLLNGNTEVLVEEGGPVFHRLASTVNSDGQWILIGGG